MLVLTRKVGESIKIGDDIYIRVVQVKGKQVRIGVEAPRETKVQREELNSQDESVSTHKTETVSNAPNSENRLAASAPDSDGLKS